MVDNLETLDDLEEEDGSPTMALAAVAGAALVAGAIAFVVKRRREPPPPPEPIAASGRAWERAREMAFNEERAQATRDFLMDKVLPEMKPALLGVLEEIEDMVDHAFRRAEKTIKSL